MKTIKELIERRKDKYRRQAEVNLKSEFKVKERGGILYLTHNDVAFKIIDTNASAADIAMALEEARAAAINFEGL